MKSVNGLVFHYVSVAGIPVCYHRLDERNGTYDLIVRDGQDQISGQPIIKGSAYRMIAKGGRYGRKVTRMASGSRTWTLRGWDYTDHELVQAIVNG